MVCAWLIPENIVSDLTVRHRRMLKTCSYCNHQRVVIFSPFVLLYPLTANRKLRLSSHITLVRYVRLRFAVSDRQWYLTAEASQCHGPTYVPDSFTYSSNTLAYGPDTSRIRASTFVSLTGVSGRPYPGLSSEGIDTSRAIKRSSASISHWPL